ncbi:MAG: ArnT family glycosyltransferase [Minisyncoccales bacterium]
MSNRSTNTIAIILLGFLFVISIFSVMGDSLTFDEKAHLPAGYSYVKKLDMRLNPEHPPLIKSLSGVPLLFMKNINFPADSPSWKNKTNAQWSFGNEFLYESNNPAEKMIFWGRFSMIIILLLLGYCIFKITQKKFGNKAGLISLALFAFSPTFIAHGRLVTTDIGGAFGIFIATYFFVKFLKNNTRKNLIISGIILGIAQLLKFTSAFLIPFFIIIGFFWWWVKKEKLFAIMKRTILVFVIAFLVIGAVYQIHIWNYPQQKQIHDIINISNKYNFEPLLKNTLVWMANKSIFRQYAHYFTGVSFIAKRVIGGNTTYFLGEISASGWPLYFPLVYLVKVPLSFHLFTLIALGYGILKTIKSDTKKNLSLFKSWVKNNLFVFSALIFVIYYWISSLNSALNIGIRHLLPIFPFIFFLVGSYVSKWIKSPERKWKYYLVIGLILFQAFSVIKVYPHFLSYFNEAIGGPNKGHKYTVGSNLDWGQDLRRLKNWTEEENIDKIYIDYFGGSDINYYFSNESFEGWWGTRNPEELPDGSYLAVSTTFLKQGQGKPSPTFDGDTGYYNWLKKYEPIKKIGNSIFIFKINKN